MLRAVAIGRLAVEWDGGRALFQPHPPAVVRCLSPVNSQWGSAPVSSMKRQQDLAGDRHASLIIPPGLHRMLRRRSAKAAVTALAVKVLADLVQPQPDRDASEPHAIPSALTWIVFRRDPGSQRGGDALAVDRRLDTVPSRRGIDPGGPPTSAGGRESPMSPCSDPTEVVKPSSSRSKEELGRLDVIFLWQCVVAWCYIW